MKPTMILKQQRVILSTVLLAAVCVFGQAAAQCVDYGSGDAIPLVTMRGLDSTPIKVVVSGTVAFLCDGQANIYPFPGLTAIDVSDPLNPRRISHTAALIGDLAISGSTLFIAGNSKLQIVDVSNPSLPAVIGTYLDDSGSQEISVAVAGPLAYLSVQGSGFKVVDVSNPSAPTLIGSLNVATRIVVVSGSTAYLQNGSRVVVVDVSDPTSPQQVGFVQLPSVVSNLAVSGTHVYVSVLTGLQIVDVSNPASPTVVGQLPGTDGPVNGSSLAISGTSLYMATFANHTNLQVIDVSNPSAPSAVGIVPGLAHAVTVSGNTLYVGSADPQVGTRGNLIVGPLQCMNSGATTGITPGDGHGKALGLAYPNPSLGKATMIPFSLPKSGTVSLRILDITGREVRTLVNQVMSQGEQLAKWDGRNNQGQLVPTGIYLYQLKTADIQEAQRLVRVKN